jgi:hypothetical protein
MKTCIIHPGAPKTGTTSIQQTLGWNLKDPKFRLISRDDRWGNMALRVLFREGSRDHFISVGTFRPQGFYRFQKSCLRTLNNSLRRAAAEGVTPVLSAEDLFNSSESDLEHLKGFMEERGFRCRVVVYIRPTHDWLESGIQQFVKTRLTSIDGLHRFIVQRSQRSLLDVLDRFDRVFQRQNVDVFAFNPSSFPNGCVVMHFCTHLGIRMDRSQIIRANESLNLNSMRLLAAWSTYGKRWSRQLPDDMRVKILVRLLQSLDGPRLIVHPSLVQSFLDQHTKDQAKLEARLGQEFPTTWNTRSAESGIRSLAELLEFPEEPLAWLARQTGQAPVFPGTGEEKAREVALQMNRLRLLSDPTRLSTELRNRMHYQWKRFWQQFN